MRLLRKLKRIPCCDCLSESGDWTPKTDLEYISNTWEERFRKRHPNYYYFNGSLTKKSTRPDESWLDQWTISKGWKRDPRSHLLTLAPPTASDSSDETCNCDESSASDFEPVRVQPRRTLWQWHNPINTIHEEREQDSSLNGSESSKGESSHSEKESQKNHAEESGSEPKYAEVSINPLYTSEAFVNEYQQFLERYPLNTNHFQRQRFTSANSKLNVKKATKYQTTERFCLVKSAPLNRFKQLQTFELSLIRETVHLRPVPGLQENFGRNKVRGSLKVDEETPAKVHREYRDRRVDEETFGKHYCDRILSPKDHSTTTQKNITTNDLNRKINQRERHSKPELDDSNKSTHLQNLKKVPAQDSKHSEQTLFAPRTFVKRPRTFQQTSRNFENPENLKTRIWIQTGDTTQTFLYQDFSPVTNVISERERDCSFEINDHLRNHPDRRKSSDTVIEDKSKGFIIKPEVHSKKTKSILDQEHASLDELKIRARIEQCVIRHVRVRVMFSLRLADGKRRRAVKKTIKMPALERASSNNALALHYAAARGCLDCVRLLVEASPELSANTQMDNDVTPVYLAAQEGHLDVLRFLVLEAGGSLYVRAKDGMAPIHAASQMGCLNCVKWMVQDQGLDPNLRDSDGATPLHFAASRGHLETVRWLLRHGARLSLDKFGKSPINDAAENQQVECLNVLVQHGTSPDYDRAPIYEKTGLSRSKSENKINKCAYSECDYGTKDGPEPFYLHPPSLKSNSSTSALTPQDGLYINPMSNHRHSASSSSESSSDVSGESFYLHNPQQVIYNRVKDLFDTNQRANQAQNGNTLTVKAEVHSSSSGAGSDENLSSSDLSDRSVDHGHEYEDIQYLRNVTEPAAIKQSDNKATKAKESVRSRSRDSGSHSRSNSLSSNNSTSNVVIKLSDNSSTQSKKFNDFLPKPQKYERVKRPAPTKQPNETPTTDESVTSDDANGSSKQKLAPRHSLPTTTNNQPRNQPQLKRVVSVPNNICSPPPPPPPPPNHGQLSTASLGDTLKQLARSHEDTDDDVQVDNSGTIKPSELLKRKVQSLGQINRQDNNASGVDAQQPTGPNLINKQLVLPFIPPRFNAGDDTNALIKPSEYLRSIHGMTRSTHAAPTPAATPNRNDYDDVYNLMNERKSDINDAKERGDSGSDKICDENVMFMGPPPPPLPDLDRTTYETKHQSDQNNNNNNQETTQTQRKQMQPLSAISIQDLNSVQLRRTSADSKMLSKSLSAPMRSMSLQSLCAGPSEFQTQKIDLIEELKMSKDITGIRKMKVERAKTEECKEKEMLSDIKRQFSIEQFVDKIPDKDQTGNIIPAWKRQMLAKKAAEKARKELEDQLAREAEEKRLQSIPAWKRALLARKEEAEQKIKSTIYTPKVAEESRVRVVHDTDECKRLHDEAKQIDLTEATPRDEPTEKSQEYEDDNIIPWRAQLRKTNSRLSLVD